MRKDARGVFLFGVVGLITTFVLLGLVIWGNAWAGWGDGATVAYRASPMAVVISWAAYFVAGIVASLSATRQVRIGCCVIAHLSPWLLLTAVRAPGDRAFLAAVILGLFAVFAALWRSLVRAA